MVRLTDQQFRAKEEALAFVNTGTSAFSARPDTDPPTISFVGVGISQESVRMYVEGGRPPAGAVPDTFNGLRTMLIQTSGFTVGPVSGIPTTPVHPTPCGVSVGHQNVTVGTLGCVVQDAQGTRYILSNNHVLADCNRGIPGDPIVQPGPADGGTVSNDTIAELTTWSPLFFDSGKSNYIDAALAKLVDPALVQPAIQMIGSINPVVVPASIGLSVHKHGRTTGHTTGVISAVSVDVFVNYDGRRAWFEDQIEIDTGFSLGGDSGSLILSAQTNEAVGLLFAGDGPRTLANPIGDVLEAFNVSLVV